MPPVKFALPLLLSLAYVLTACNTVENQRSLYSPAKGDGPYTRSLENGTWTEPKTVDQEYADAKKRKKSTPAATAEPAAE